jgi:hypothetical protein
MAAHKGFIVYDCVKRSRSRGGVQISEWIKAHFARVKVVRRNQYTDWSRDPEIWNFKVKLETMLT